METVVLDATHMVVGGDAIAREDNGRVVFVSGAIAGETVRVLLTTAKKDFARAAVTDVIVASPDRVPPPCEAWHRGCGGCDWQHITPLAQLRYKTAIVAEALARTARVVDPVVVGYGSIEPWGYRTTVRLTAGRAGVGFRARRSHDIVPVRTCPVASPAINNVIGGMISAIADGGLGAYDDMGPTEITVRVSKASGAANCSTAPDAHLEEVVAGHRLRVSIGSFFQSSPEAAELIVAAVGRACADIDMATARVIDAYGGVGLFAATVAARAADVILVEGSPSACADARVNLAGRSATVVESRVEDWRPVDADLVIADPARSGLDKQAAAVLAETGAQVLVLVSCDPGSLARDCRLLTGFGYEHQGSYVIDAFPNTSHIETVTRFARTEDRLYTH